MLKVRKSCMLIHVRAYFCLERAGKCGENVEKCCIPGTSRSNKRQDGDGMMKEAKEREQKIMMMRRRRMMLRTMMLMMTT